MENKTLRKERVRERESERKRNEESKRRVWGERVKVKKISSDQDRMRMCEGEGEREREREGEKTTVTYDHFSKCRPDLTSSKNLCLSTCAPLISSCHFFLHRTIGAPRVSQELSVIN